MKFLMLSNPYEMLLGLICGRVSRSSQSFQLVIFAIGKFVKYCFKLQLCEVFNVFFAKEDNKKHSFVAKSSVS